MCDNLIMKIVNYTTDAAVEVTDLFYAAVHGIDPSVYSQQQKEAWAPIPPNYEKWAERLEEKKPCLAILEQRIVGFIELDPDGHIDCTYTLPDYQGRGVASALFNHVEEIALTRGYKRLYVEASFLAKSLFEKQGFKVLHENKIERGNVILSNFTMEKWL